MRTPGVLLSVIALPLVLALGLSLSQSRHPTFAADEGVHDIASVHADVVATGIPGAGAIAQIGKFHTGGPFHDNPAFAPSTAPGMVLDGRRLFVASSSNFGAPLARSTDAPGAILSIDVSGGAADPRSYRRISRAAAARRAPLTTKSFSTPRRVPPSSTGSRMPTPRRISSRQ